MPTLQNEHSKLKIFLRRYLDIVIAPFNDFNFHAHPLNEGSLVSRMESFLRSLFKRFEQDRRLERLRRLKYLEITKLQNLPNKKKLVIVPFRVIYLDREDSGL